jgi:hypothetical protein
MSKEGADVELHEQGGVSPASERIKEEKISEHEAQTLAENQCREQFIKDVIMASSLSPEEKALVSHHVMTEAGVWRHYNGIDVTLADGYAENGILHLLFEVDDQDVEVLIPLSAKNELAKK